MLNTIDTLSREELNLFNPYYCSVLLYNLLNTEESKGNDGLDCSLLFLTLPLIMSREVNECMPYTKKTTLYTWLDDNPWILVRFDERVKYYFDLSLLALKILRDYKIVNISLSGRVILNPERKLPSSAKLLKQSNNFDKHLKTASLLGNWFSSHTTSSIYTAFGVQP